MVLSRTFAVIPTFNGSRYIRECLLSLSLELSNQNIIIVDNCSIDNTLDLANQFEGIVVIQSPKNLGFAHACNKGIRNALRLGAKNIVLVNQDVIVGPNAIKNCLARINDVPLTGILSCIHYQSDQVTLDKNFSLQLSTISDRPLSDILANQNSLLKCKFVNAAFWILTADCINKVGLIDETFFMYGEDVNYTHRVLFHGLSISIYTGAYIVHRREDRDGNPSVSVSDADLSLRLILRNPNTSILAKVIRTLKLFIILISNRYKEPKYYSIFLAGRYARLVMSIPASVLASIRYRIEYPNSFNSNNLP